MAGALDGLLVVAIEQAVSAPVCTLRLADAGARVIKIERAEGETARNYDQTVHGVSAYFAWLNRGKESAVLDLKVPDDLALVKTIAAKADVFVQNLAPGAAERLGLSAAQLVKVHPRIIAVDIVGYGQDTDYRDMRAYDMLIQAESGICAVTGTPDVPSKVGVSVADIATGMNAHAMVLEALIARGISGKGRAIEVAMFDSMADWMSVPLLHLEYGKRETHRHGLSHASIYPYTPFKCFDGEVIIAIQNNLEWARFCEGVLGQAALVKDARFESNAQRVANRKAVDIEISKVFAQMSCVDAIARLEVSGIAWARVSTVADAARHKALRKFPVSLEDGTIIDMPLPAGREVFEARPVPGLGEHTVRIRREFAA
jgi:itaconate CoA-transferase